MSKIFSLLTYVKTKNDEEWAQIDGNKNVLATVCYQAKLVLDFSEMPTHYVCSISVNEHACLHNTISFQSGSLNMLYPINEMNTWSLLIIHKIIQNIAKPGRVSVQ